MLMLLSSDNIEKLPKIHLSALSLLPQSQFYLNTLLDLEEKKQLEVHNLHDELSWPSLSCVALQQEQM